MASKNDSLNSTIGQGSVFEGKFYISGSLKIDGKFEGEIKTDEELYVGESGKVKTDIVAKNIVVAGTVIGNLHATEEIQLLETGKVYGDISAPFINISRGVVCEGKITLTGHAKKDPKKVIDESYNTNSLKHESSKSKK